MCILWIFLVHELFELLIAIEVDRVPELRPTLMQVVNAIQVHIFFVPAEHGLPGANINVGIGDARYFLAI